MRRIAAATLLGLALGARAAEPWADGDPRPFLAGRVELGLHERAQLQAGFGKPHWAWAGAQGSAFTTREVAGVEGALRAVLPFADASVALRQTRSWAKPALAPLEVHRDAELDGGHLALSVLDVGLSGVVPLLGGLAVWEGEWVRPLDLAPATHAYEEVWRVVVGPRGAAAARLGWVTAPIRGRVRLGPYAEAIQLAGRGVEPVWRAGGLLGWRLSPHLQLVAYGLFPVSGPDRLGFIQATNGSVAVRWSFASGDPLPPLP